MAEDIEQVDAEPLGGRSFHAEEVCLHLGISTEILELCVRWDVIVPSRGETGEVVFDEQAMERIRSGLRLHRDLGINWPGVAVVLDLLDRMETLERELDVRFQRPDW